MKLIVGIGLILSFFVTFCAAQESEYIFCSYYLWQLRNTTTYECALNISNPIGLDNFTRIDGDHYPGFNDHNVTEIPFANGLTTNIPQIICRQFPNLQVITLDRIGIEFVDNNSFRGCRNVVRLYINGNEISSVSVDAFWRNEKLKTLDMSGNSIQNISENIFDNLSNLEVLNLSFNDFESIPNDTFKELSNLLDLRLAGVRISRINTAWFENLDDLRFLYLYANDIAELYENTFDDLDDLAVLNLSFNPINGNFPPKIFDSLSKLTDLHLDDTGITDLNPKWFAELDKLEFLYLTANNISNLPDNIFDELQNLMKLDISFNFLTVQNMPSATFDNLKTLFYLDLSYNLLNSLNPQWFRHLQNLTTLLLTNNRISELPFGVFRPIGSLVQLFLGNNNLMSINRNDFGNLNSLAHVYVQGNQIIAADKQFFDDARSLSFLNFLNNSCASENFRLFYLNRENYMQRLSRCFDNSRFFVDTQTNFTMNYTFHEGRYPGLHAQILSSRDVHITLSNSHNPRIDIIIGAQNNTRTIIQNNLGSIYANVSTPNILQASQWRTFRVTWVNNVILVFRGDERFPFIAHTMDRPFLIDFYGLKSPYSHTGWRVRPINIQRH
ncbi:carboxypeptidase N subunit 2-like [Chironomus tepperi]|uniref:carboxypeptidase N subunit 2-like n=1 Tax=Chironomus tepperi TaxID=113505 RepID=UPI00391F3BB0